MKEFGEHFLQLLSDFNNQMRVLINVKIIQDMFLMYVTHLSFRVRLSWGEMLNFKCVDYFQVNLRNSLSKLFSELKSGSVV